MHAINKGLERATGDILAFINSDDVYLPGAFNAVMNHFDENPESEWVCGDTIMFGEGHDTNVIRAVVPRSAAHCLSWAYRAPQPGHFWKTELVKSGFQERWNYDFDHDMYVRLLLAGHKCDYLPLPMAGYRFMKSVRRLLKVTGNSKSLIGSPSFTSHSFRAWISVGVKRPGFCGFRTRRVRRDGSRKQQLVDARVCNSS